MPANPSTPPLTPVAIQIARGLSRANVRNLAEMLQGAFGLERVRAWPEVDTIQAWVPGTREKLATALAHWPQYVRKVSHGRDQGSSFSASSAGTIVQVELARHVRHSDHEWAASQLGEMEGFTVTKSLLGTRVITGTLDGSEIGAFREAALAVPGVLRAWPKEAAISR